MPATTAEMLMHVEVMMHAEVLLHVDATPSTTLEALEWAQVEGASVPAQILRNEQHDGATRRTNNFYRRRHCNLYTSVLLLYDKLCKTFCIFCL